MSLTAAILAHACALGFDRAAVLPVGPPHCGAQFAAWLDAGYHGEMTYLAARAAERLDPARLVPGATSLIVVARNYNPGLPSQPLAGPSQGRIARYARWPDYHAAIKPKLFALDAFIRAQTGRQAPGKAFVDSAPVLERDFAEQADLGFIGRNTCLITPGLGSWTFLAGLFVPENLTLPPSPARRGGEEIGCGRCTRCLDACPTGAFVAPHVLDARRCISYLTIELRGPIRRDLRPLMGNWVFGCDVCQEVCPYNRVSRAAQTGIEASAGFLQHPQDRLRPRFQDHKGASSGQDLGGAALAPALPLVDLLALDEARFRARFCGTPVLRAKRRGLVRNACVAAGNSGDPALVTALIALLADPEPLVRGHAAWALSRIGGDGIQPTLAHALAAETDLWARSELALAMTLG